MKKMIWQHDERFKEPVFVLGVVLNHDLMWNQARAYVLDADQKFHDIPANELKLTVEDYNKIFAV